MIQFIALGGFLGAGKTTTILAAATHLEAQGRTVAVITNDQGTSLADTKLVDAERPSLLTDEPLCRLLRERMARAPAITR